MLKEWADGKASGFKKGNTWGKLLVGEKSPRWTGGYKYHHHGASVYKWLKVDGKYVAEHRHLMEVKLGRKLDKKEAVHHIDGNGLNNELDNLEILSWGEHKRKHSGSYLYGKNFKCSVCCEEKRHCAKGMCKKCYDKKYHDSYKLKHQK